MKSCRRSINYGELSCLSSFLLVFLENKDWDSVQLNCSPNEYLFVWLNICIYYTHLLHSSLREEHIIDEILKGPLKSALYTQLCSVFVTISMTSSGPTMLFATSVTMLCAWIFFFIVCLGVLDLELDKTAKRGHNLSLWWSEQRQAVESLACHLSSTPLCRTTGQWQLGQQWCPPTLFCIFESFSPLHHLINYWPDFCGFSLHTSALAPNMFSATGVRYLPQSQKNGNFL